MAENIPRASGSGPMLVTPASWEALRQRVEENELIADPKDFDVGTRGGKRFLRLRGVPGATRPGPPPVPALLLSAGANGARVYQGVLEWSVFTLEFERHTISGKKVNGLIGQDAIEGVEIMKRDGAEEAAEEEGFDGWWDLGWWGDVWAKVILDPETGEPTSWDIVGPDKPEMQPIAALDQNLSRDGGSGGEGDTGFVVFLGNVPEDGAIVQERTGNLQWFCAFVPTNEASSGGDSSGVDESSAVDDSSGGDSSGGDDSGGGSESEKSSNAIVSMPWHPEGYGAMATIESNEVLFEFILRRRPLRWGRNTFQIDPRFIAVCDAHSFTAQVQGDRPWPLGVEVIGERVILRALPFFRPRFVTIRLTGVRKGFGGWNMPPRTASQKAQADASNLAQYDRIPGQL